MKRFILGVIITLVFLLQGCGQKTVLKNESYQQTDNVEMSSSAIMTSVQFADCMNSIGFYELKYSKTDIAKIFGITETAIKDNYVCTDDYDNYAIFISFINEDVAKLSFENGLLALQEEEYSYASIQRSSGTDYDRAYIDNSEYSELAIVSRVKNTLVFVEGFTDEGTSMQSVNSTLKKVGY